MTSKDLDGVRVAVIAADGFEQVELTWPVEALRDQGARVEVISLRRGSIQGFNLLVPGKQVHVDRTIFTASANTYDALLLPGGFFNPDFLRQSKYVLRFVRAFDQAGKPIAVICHGPWVLVSAGLVQGRRLTSWPGIQDDIRNAGGIWEDTAVVHDGNWVSSRGPQDIKQFSKAMVTHFAAHVQGAARTQASGMPWGRWLGSGLALAMLAYGGRRR